MFPECGPVGMVNSILVATAVGSSHGFPLGWCGGQTLLGVPSTMSRSNDSHTSSVTFGLHTRLLGLKVASGFDEIVDRSGLLEAFADSFVDEELQTLCFELGVDYDDLAAQGKTNKARELIDLSERTHGLEALIPLGQYRRPNVVWSSFLRASTDSPAPFKGPEYYDVADANLFFGRHKNCWGANHYLQGKVKKF